MFNFEGRQKKEIGMPGFSRTRKFNDEQRKARIFREKADIAVDVDQLEQQIKDKNYRKELEDDERKKFEWVQKYQLHKWNEADEELRKWRIENRRDMEEFWHRQNDEFKERWKKQYHQFNAYDPISIIPASRYFQQDEEPVVDAQRKSAVFDVIALQVKENKEKKQWQEEQAEQEEFERVCAMERLKRYHQELEEKQKMEQSLLNEELQRTAHKKAEREKQKHFEEHHYQIHHSFFDQFGTTSR